MGTIGILLFGWNYTRQVCLLDVDSLGRVVMEALGEGETFNKRFPLKESLVPPGARKEKLVPPTRWPHLLNTNQDLIYNKTWKNGKPGIWTKVGKKNKDLQWKAAHKKTMCLWIAPVTVLANGFLFLQVFKKNFQTCDVTMFYRSAPHIQGSWQI